jgi:hypothetical protein
VLEAIHCGAVVVSERSTHFSPLEPGRHFATGTAEELDRLADELLDSPERLDAMRRAAYEHIRARLRMSDAASMLAEAAERIAAQPTARPRRTLPRPPRPRGLRARAAALVRQRPRSVDPAAPPSGPPSDAVELSLVEDGDRLLLIDARDRLLPNGLERMRAALTADPDAGFAYGIVQLIGDRGPEGIANHFGWDPARRDIHTPVLVRRGAVQPVGGNGDELWSALSARDLRGVHVREFVASSTVAVPAEVAA